MLPNVLRAETVLPLTKYQVFPFFADASNLGRMTPPDHFVDEQVQGPYALWHHTHTFTAADGGTRIDDTVRYVLPLGMLGRVALPIVRAQLQRIFAFRQEAVRRILVGENS